MEPIEQWRKEFEIGKSEQVTQRDSRNPEKYWNDPMQYRWEGFCEAKRYQPVVELPSQWLSYEVSPTPDLSTWYRADLTHKSLTAAGIQYRIKGE